jgi:putative chitinase
MNVTQLALLMPRAPSSWLIALATEMPRWNIDTPARESAFIGQIAHESAGMTKLEENLNYSAEALMRVWPKRFNAERAQLCERNPERIANVAYASRLGNGDEISGDGWRYRGRGPIQLTGKANYKEYGAAILADLLGDPDAVARVPKIGCAVACRFWMVNGCNDLADEGDIGAITKKVNGGDHGLQDRIRLTAEAVRVLAA